MCRPARRLLTPPAASPGSSAATPHRQARPRVLPLTLPASLVLLALLSSCGLETEYPARPITIVCPWGMGGGTDGLSRQMAHLLQEKLGVTCNVINKTGGEGVTGHSEGALARPDGYTLTMMTSELNMLHWRGLTSIGHEDFRTLMVLNRDAAALFVRDDAPWKDLKSLEAAIRSRPGELTASGTAKGGTWHLAFAGWLDAVGLEPTSVRWIPTQGAASSLQELVAGGLEMVCCSLPEAQPLVEAGRLRALGVMSDERLADFPTVPTFREQGDEWSFGGWRALGVPRSTPDRIVETLSTALREIVASPGFLDFMRSRGFGVSIEEGAVAVANLDRMDAAMGKLLTSPAFAEVDKRRFGPLFFPTILALVLAALTLAAAIGARGRAREPRDESAVRWRILVPIAGVAAYAVLAESFGFVLIGGAVLASFLLILGNRVLVAITVSVIVVVPLYHLFAVELGVPLPRGVLGW